MTEETGTTEQKDKKEAEIESLPDDPEYLKYLEQQKGYQGGSRRSRRSTFYSAVYPRLGEGYTHDPKFLIIRSVMELTYPITRKILTGTP